MHAERNSIRNLFGVVSHYKVSIAPSISAITSIINQTKLPVNRGGCPKGSRTYYTQKILRIQVKLVLWTPDESLGTRS